MKTITYAQAVRSALIEEMDRDPSVLVLGEDIGTYGGVFTATRSLLARYGVDRVIDTPILEAAIAGAAVGMAMCGLRPVAEIMYEDFVTISLDQLVNNAAKMHYMFDGKVCVPLVLRTQCGSGRGSAAQHSQSLESWFAHVPGLIVIMPSTPQDARGLLKSAIRNDNPVIFIEHKMLYFTKGPDTGAECLPIGKAEVKREGSDITVIATSWMVGRALEAAELAANEGVSVEVIDPRTLRPFDTETVLASARKTRRAVVVHEAVRFCGIGAEISSIITENLFHELEMPVKRLCGSDVPIPYSAALEPHVVPTVEDIHVAVTTMATGAGRLDAD
jgi:pyruvate/2-oxoglutarate/acetoin dehydrogenase E1 component